METMILRALMGSVLVYSSPRPSTVKRASGVSRASIAPKEVALIIMTVLKADRFEIIRAIITLSRTGRAKKKAVDGFLEVVLKSFKT